MYGITCENTNDENKPIKGREAQNRLRVRDHCALETICGGRGHERPFCAVVVRLRARLIFRVHDKVNSLANDEATCPGKCPILGNRTICKAISIGKYKAAIC